MRQKSYSKTQQELDEQVVSAFTGAKYFVGREPKRYCFSTVTYKKLIRCFFGKGSIVVLVMTIEKLKI